MKIKTLMLTIILMFVFSKAYSQLDTAFISATKSICLDSIKTISDMWRYSSEALSKYNKNIRNTNNYIPKFNEVSTRYPYRNIYETCTTTPTPADKNRNYLLEGILNALFE
jgi:hypothetical protein